MRSLGGLAVAGLAMTCVLASLLGFDGRVRLGGHLADSNSSDSLHSLLPRLALWLTPIFWAPRLGNTSIL